MVAKLATARKITLGMRWVQPSSQQADVVGPVWLTERPGDGPDELVERLIAPAGQLGMEY
jgi:hypothetical protein